MYAWSIRRNAVGAETEDELLIELLTSWTVVLRGSPDSFDGVRGFDCRCSIWLDKAALYLCCEGRGVLFSVEGALHVSINCYNTAWSGHLEFEIGIVWDLVETSERGSSEQRMVATAERDDVEDQVFASEVVWRTEDDLQCD